VPGVEIHLDQESFVALVEHVAWVNDLRKNPVSQHNAYQYGMNARAADIVEQHENECLKRQKSPALKDAYERYQMLLNLVE